MPRLSYWNDIPWVQADRSYSRFDLVYSPSTPAPFTGIYRCTVCKYEIARSTREALPIASDTDHKQWGCFDDSGL
jgi:hypothetical protein